MNNKFDVIVIGGGVIGHSVAFQLSQGKGISVALVDKYKSGKASWASCGGLWAVGESVGLGCGVIFFRALSANKVGNKQYEHFLPQFFLEYADKSNEMFPSLCRELEALSGVETQFRKTGLSFVAYDELDMAYAKTIYEKVNAFKPELVRLLDKKDIHEIEPYITDRAMGGLIFPSDSDANPYLLELAFRGASQANGVTFIEDTEVVDFITNKNKVEGVKTDQGECYYCDTVVNAAGTWSGQLAEKLDITLPIKPIKGQILLSEKLPPILKSGVSTADCYISQKTNGEILIGSTTEDLGFCTETDISKLSKLAYGAVRAIPELTNLKVKRSWAGLRPATPDEIPIFGPVDGWEGYLNATGNFRTGIVTAPITGKIIRSFVLGEAQPIDIKPFLYERFTNGTSDMDALPSYHV